VEVYITHIDNDQWCLFRCIWSRIFSAIYLVLSILISFDQNGFHVNPNHLVGHSYVIFDNHVSPPVYLHLRIFGVYLSA
jgi:hypothetical protein